MKLPQNTFLALFAAFSVAIVAKTDAGVFAKFDGIDGEAVHAGADGFIKLGDIKGEIVNNNGTVEFGEMSLSFEIDKASPRLMLACANQITIPEVTIQLTRIDGSGTETAYYQYKLKNVTVSSYKNELKVGTDVPVDQITLGYTEIEWIYIVRDSSGQVVETVTTGPLS